jgi:hypothetical protein
MEYLIQAGKHVFYSKFVLWNISFRWASNFYVNSCYGLSLASGRASFECRLVFLNTSSGGHTKLIKCIYVGLDRTACIYCGVYTVLLLEFLQYAII